MISRSLIRSSHPIGTWPRRLHGVSRWLALASIAAAIALGCLAGASAQAGTYGQLRNFGSKGAGPGQFTITAKTHAFGVDPTDNSVYVLDVPASGVFRIQKLSATGAFLASVSFTPPTPVTSIEGIAISAAEKRIYVLAVYRRLATSAVDPSRSAAGTLYAFSTEAQGSTLVPASGAGPEGVLASESVLNAQSEVQEDALLDPRGIAVDPSTHDVIILGDVDQGAPEGHEPQERVALQRVHANGTLGARYVDSGLFFGEEEPNSPVVSPSGDVYVQEYDRIVRIPSDFASTEPPTPLFQFALEGPLQERLLEFDTPATEPPVQGAALSLLPEGTSEGAIFAYGRIKEDVEEGVKYPGVIAFKYSEQGAVPQAAESGWTGGLSKRSGAKECVIGLNSVNPNYPMVAAGAGQTVFVFDPSVPQVLEFGPGGEGCPAASATEPQATINGQPLQPSESVSVGTPVTFSSTLTQANALSVEWDFGDGQTQTEPADEHQHTEITHSFVRGGALTVTETIHTDDLATPTIVKTTEVSVSVTAPPPTAVLEGPLEVTLGGGVKLERLGYLEGGGLDLEGLAPSEEATFDASASYASSASGPNTIVQYHWTFGDGTSASTAGAVVTHRYERVGVYKVELTVTDALGLTSEPSTLTVKVVAPSPQSPSETAVPSTGPTASPIVPAPAPAAVGGEGKATSAPGRQSRPIPDVRLLAVSSTVGASGVASLELTCPAAERNCAGIVTLRAIGASARAHGGAAAKPGSRSLIIAAGTFAVVGGHERTVKLRLSIAGRALLARAHVLRARATILAHDAAGTTHTTQTIVTLHARRSARRG